MLTALLPRTLAMLLAAALLVAGAARAQDESHVLDLASYPRTTLEISHHAAGQPAHRFPFTVWVADTQPRAEQGLMFVRDLPEGLGMIFPLEPPRIENMWMKNTYIELDMLFIDSNGRVAKILARARPLSEQILSSDIPVAAVLELKGGAAARLGLQVGDSVSWKKPAPR
jgi:uncharacterized protein